MLSPEQRGKLLVAWCALCHANNVTDTKWAHRDTSSDKVFNEQTGAIREEWMTAKSAFVSVVAQVYPAARVEWWEPYGDVADKGCRLRVAGKKVVQFLFDEPLRIEEVSHE